MNYFLKEYINSLTEKDIYNYGLKEGVTLTDDEVKTIYLYIKNYWETLIKDDSTFIFEELKEKLSPKAYQKVIELFNKYKKYLKK